MKKLLLASVFIAFAPFTFATESKDSVAPHFSSLDVNGDKYITQDEVTGTAFFEKFSQIDTNMDKMVNEEEYLAYVAGESKESDTTEDSGAE